MTQQELDQLLSLLEMRKKVVVKKITELKNMLTVEAPDCAVDRVDRTLDMMEKERLSKALRLKEIQRVKIDKALVKIAEGRYGFCEQCGKEISLERLMVLPESENCMVCSGVVKF